ncbi:MAG: glycosyltransferase family 2 protein [Nevskia sp.]|nr:glycosyltransferase family 2 protein [Nevskia sp.]
MFRPCLVVPYYRHERAIGALIARLKPHGVACWIVDDGSGGAASSVVQALAEREASWLQLLSLPINSGKGAAVHAGCRAAYAAGFSHALQIDADGQHDTGDVPKLLALAAAQPQAVVTGVPLYDTSVPKVRLYGRRITHALVWLHTLSFEIVDSMCGMRVYPLSSALALWAREPVAQRMDFDTDILVRLYWSGLRVVSVPTRVTYPTDGVSHFHYLRDNLRMARLHLRLFGGMLRRAPRWLWRRLRGGRADGAMA